MVIDTCRKVSVLLKQLVRHAITDMTLYKDEE